ncbi:hypothetical protein U1Q18_026309, partial [Sarracenia purpurea var. burkii]
FFLLLHKYATLCTSVLHSAAQVCCYILQWRKCSSILRSGDIGEGPPFRHLALYFGDQTPICPEFCFGDSLQVLME